MRKALMYAAAVLCPLVLSGANASAAIFSRGVVAEFQAYGYKYEVAAHQVRRIDSSGSVTAVKISYQTNAMIRYFRPAVTQIDYAESGIGPVLRDGDKIWFAIDFYSGEGSVGIGGIGFVDMKTMRMGLLRHPALTDCAADGIRVDPKEIVVNTYYFGEGVFGTCHGRVVIDRASLRAWQCADKPDPPALRGKLPCDVSGRQLITGPGVSIKEPLDSAELDDLMLQETDFERDWFAQAAESGKVDFDQHCEINATEMAHQIGSGQQPVCTTPRQGRFGIDIDADSTQYPCEQAGFLSLSVGTPTAKVGGTVYAPGPRRWSNDQLATRKTPVAQAGMQWSAVAEDNDLFARLVLEDVKMVNLRCWQSFSWRSGPAIASVRLWLRITNIDQAYRPKRTTSSAFSYGRMRFAGS